MPDHATWLFINSFADWFSAFGTISAVVAAIYLARQDKRVRLSVFAGHRVVVTQGLPDSARDYLTIGVTNVGHRDSQIVGVGWRVGLFRKQLLAQTVMRDGISSDMPIRLRDGEEARYYIPLSGDPEWLKDFTKKTLLPNARLRVKFIWVVIFTSVGRVFTARIEKGLQNRLREFAERQAAL